MLAIGILLLVFSVICFASGMGAFGDIGISMIYTAVTALLSGLGFVIGSRRRKE